MARILLLDDDRDTCQALADLLAKKGHDVRHAADPLTLRRQYGSLAGTPEWRPAVVLVELLRWHGNGFSLAATMSRATEVPVLLLSDRGLRDDCHWARARGIYRVVDRRAEGTELLAAIAELSGQGASEQNAPRPETPLPRPPSAQQDGAPAPSRQQAATQPLVALLLQHVDQLLAGAALLKGSQREEIAAWQQRCVGALQKLGWVNDLLPEQARCGIGGQELLTLDEDEFTRRLLRWRYQLDEAMYTASAGFEPTPPASPSSAMASPFLAMDRQLNQWTRRVVQELADMKSGAVAESAANASSGDRRLKVATRQLLHAVLASRVLGGLSDTESEARMLSLLSVLHDEAVCRDVVSSELVARFKGQHGPLADCAGSPQPNSCVGTLGECLRVWRADPDRDGFQRLVISVYRLLVLARLTSTEMRYRVALGSLYFSAASCLTVNELYRQQAGQVVETLECWHQARQRPDQALLWRIASLECRVASRLPDEQARFSLASGLYHLPRPERMLRSPSTDLSGPLRSEIMRELEMLVAGARELEVQKVEALAAMMLELHRQLASLPDPETELEARPVMAFCHARLCRLLDQAAAWQTPGDISDVMVRIGRYLVVHEGSPQLSSGCPGMAWNRHMAGLIRQSRDLQDIRGLLLEMLLGQRNALIDCGLRPASKSGYNGASDKHGGGRVLT